jgi:hypothetical protein
VTLRSSVPAYQCKSGATSGLPTSADRVTPVAVNSIVLRNKVGYAERVYGTGGSVARRTRGPPRVPPSLLGPLPHPPVADGSVWTF